MITFENVSKVYPNGVKGLQNIDVTIEQGEFVAIIGLSGAGKSTFALDQSLSANHWRRYPSRRQISHESQ